MRAVVNRPDSDTDVEIVEVEAPTAGPGEVLMQVRSSSLNRGELRLLAMRPAGWRPGQDVVGTVLSVGEGAEAEVGAVVVGRVDGGGWAEQVAVPADRISALPPGVDPDEAATLPIAGLTALRVLRLGGNLLGARVLVTGASGAVGQFAVQLGVIQGAEVTAVARAEHGDRLRALGATAVVEQVADAGDAAYDHVVDSIGGVALEQAIAATVPGATVVLFGASADEPARISFRDFVGHHGVRLQPFQSYLSPWPDDADLAIMVALLADGRLRAPVERRVSWRDLPEAVALLRDRQVHGKIVLTID